MANASKGKGTVATAKGNITQPNPAVAFAPGSHGQTVWALLWPTLRQGKPVTMAQVVAAWQTAMQANPHWGNTGNTQSAAQRAKGVNQWVQKGVLQHVPGQRGIYALGAKFNYTPKARATAPQATAPQATAPQATAPQATAPQAT